MKLKLCRYLSTNKGKIPKPLVHLACTGGNSAMLSSANDNLRDIFLLFCVSLHNKSLYNLQNKHTRICSWHHNLISDMAFMAAKFKNNLNLFMSPPTSGGRRIVFGSVPVGVHLFPDNNLKNFAYVLLIRCLTWTEGPVGLCHGLVVRRLSSAVRRPSVNIFFSKTTGAIKLKLDRYLPTNEDT